MFLLDTNVLVTLMNGRSHPLTLRLKAEMKAGTIVLISCIVLFALRYGIAKSIRAEKRGTQPRAGRAP